MKTYNLCIVFSCVLFMNSISIFCQCGDIVLWSQEDINNFIKNYGKCSTVQNLKIYDLPNDIIQYDSLYHIERIEGLFEMQNGTDAVKNLDGFRNLKFVNDLFLYTANLKNTFISLDTVNHLYLLFDSTTFRSLDSLKFIRKSFRFSPIHYCTSHHLSNFSIGPNFSMTIYTGNKSFSSCFQRLAKNIETKNLKSLKLRGVNHQLSDLNFIDSLETLILIASSPDLQDSSDLSAIKELTKLKNIKIFRDKGINDYGEGFKQTYHLDTLILEGNWKIMDYTTLFPNLKTISSFLNIIENADLINLDFLKEVTLPRVLKDSMTIVIKDNKLLDECNVPFLCEALARYPNLVEIYNNGPKCTKEEILKYCQTVHTTQVEHSKLVIGPNPTFGYLNIQNIQSPVSITIYDMMGQVVKTLKDIHSEVDIDDLPAGMYIFDISNKTINERHKIIKIE